MRQRRLTATRALGRHFRRQPNMGTIRPHPRMRSMFNWNVHLIFKYTTITNEEVRLT